MLPVSRPVRVLLDLFKRRDIAWTIVALNLIGFVVGTIYWYGPQFLEGKNGIAPSPLLWVFIPDCPLFAGLFVVSFLSLQRNRHWTWFNTIVTIGLIKYGIWTVTFWATYWGMGQPVTVEGIVMVVAHLGMIVEGIYLLTQIKAQVRHAVLALLWFVVSDYVDYGLGQYPMFYPPVPLWLMQWHTIAMTWILSAWVAFLAWRKVPVTGRQGVSMSHVSKLP